MGKKRAKPLVITSQQQFDAQKPRFNAHQTGHGAHGTKGYKRHPKHKGQPEA